jgi:two-component sensor histidine kinase
MAGSNVCDTSKVIEAFKESRDHVVSMALIHEELYKSTDTSVIDFSDYIKKLVSYLLNSYQSKTDNISLKLNIEEVHLEMDIAVPLGSIATELISNAMKHAFPDGRKGEISIFLTIGKITKSILRSLELSGQTLNVKKWRICNSYLL